MSGVNMASGNAFKFGELYELFVKARMRSVRWWIGCARKLVLKVHQVQM